PICMSASVNRCSNWPTAAGSRPSARGSAVAATAAGDPAAVRRRARCRVARWARSAWEPAGPRLRLTSRVIVEVGRDRRRPISAWESPSASQLAIRRRSSWVSLPPGIGAPPACLVAKYAPTALSLQHRQDRLVALRCSRQCNDLEDLPASMPLLMYVMLTIL